MRRLHTLSVLFADLKTEVAFIVKILTIGNQSGNINRKGKKVLMVKEKSLSVKSSQNCQLPRYS